MTDTAEISKNTIRNRAAAFARRWHGTTSEQAEKQTFWNELFAVFGIDRKTVGKFEALAERASTGNPGWIDFLYPNEMAVEHKSAGKDLDAAMGQLLDYLPSVHASITPWLLVVCDFSTFKWRNLEDRTSGEFTLAELPDNLHLFWWMAGHETPNEAFATEVDVNLAATEKMAALHDALRASGYPEGARRVWMTRLLFCLFADDTDVWDRAAFHTFVAHQTRADGSDLGSRLAELFQVLNQRPEDRSRLLDEDLASFTYINGDLFADQIPIPACDEVIRSALLAACGFNWSKISPAIFGSMFQNVMTAAERRQLGAHYTTEANILRTIRPLFLDALEAELQAATSEKDLQAFHDKLAGLTFFDPACGCGNFLVIAYREVRRLETITLRKLAARQAGQRVGRRGSRTTRHEGQLVASLEFLCKVRVDQFYGIEIEEFPARIARTALYLMDHIANREVSAEFGEHYVRFPIPATTHIVIDNAITLDWNEVLPSDRASFVFGNPPFIGKKARTPDQQSDMVLVFGGRSGTASLDYVAAWYEKAVSYVTNPSTLLAFVSTSSITQGEQVAILWPRLRNAGLTIGFAHRPFKWTSEARGSAHVHCVIIGFSKGPWPRPPRLFEYDDVNGEPTELPVSRISAHLVEGPDVFVDRRRNPLSPVPSASLGSMPNDNNQLLVSEAEVDDVLSDPIARNYLREMLSAREMLHGRRRWCLWLENATPTELRTSPLLRARIEGVRRHREASTRATTRALARTPYLFGERRQPTTSYLCVPRHTSEGRDFIPMIFAPPEMIASDSTIAIPSADHFLFGILQSEMFGAWQRGVGGRLEGRLRFSVELVYNNFPFPAAAGERARHAVETAAMGLLAARSKHAAIPLADLYDPLVMPAELVAAHRALDTAVDSAFGFRADIGGDAKRLAFLLNAYLSLAAPLTHAASRPRRARRA